MSIINVLPEEIVKKISAGEVIERPASVVKELLENSLDAKALNISVEIRQGGSKLIKMKDDGRGMNRDDLKICADRNTTSKIRQLEDIYNISTLGFRGEALSSISAVSKTEIFSRYEDLPDAYRLTVTGKKKELLDAEGGKGTTITVSDLFYNVPARLKFLKSPETETGHINDVIFRLALYNFKVGFEFKADGREYLNVSPVKTLKERLYQLFGEDTAKSLMEIKREEAGVIVTGFVSAPANAKSNRNYLYTFINGRLVSDKTVNHAVSAGFGNLIPYGKFPLAVILIKVDPEKIDVNVHPTKREVKFSNGNLVHGVVERAIKEVLVKEKPIEEIKAGVGSEIPAGKNEASNYSFGAGSSAAEIPEAFEKRAAFIQEGLLNTDKYRLKPLYQAKNMYIIAVDGESVYIIDQHVAHEKILYEGLKEEDPKVRGSQQLLVPISIILDIKGASILKKNLEELKGFGFEIEPIGKESFMINGVPLFLALKSPEKVLLEVIEQLEDDSIKSHSIKDKHDTLIKTLACHSAVRAGDSLGYEQMLVLVNDFQKCDLPYCPHGRPGMIKITFDELDKKFKRT